MLKFSDLVPVAKQVSPSTPNNHGYADPTPPGTAAYKADHEMVELTRLCIQKGRWPVDLFTSQGIDPVLSPLLAGPLRLSESRPDRCCDVVQMDHPFDIWDIVVEPYARAEGIKLNPTPLIGIPFVESTLARARAHLLIARGLAKAFEVKAYFDQLRPAQYNQAGDMIQKYPHPAHPEKPAGHGAFCGGAAKAFELFYLPTPEQIEAVKTATKQFATFRTFAGVHIPSSNMLGWQIGYDMTE